MIFLNISKIFFLKIADSSAATLTFCLSQVARAQFYVAEHTRDTMYIGTAASPQAISLAVTDSSYQKLIVQNK